MTSGVSQSCWVESGSALAADVAKRLHPEQHYQVRHSNKYDIGLLTPAVFCTRETLSSRAGMLRLSEQPQNHLVLHLCLSLVW